MGDMLSAHVAEWDTCPLRVWVLRPLSVQIMDFGKAMGQTGAVAIRLEAMRRRKRL